MSVQMTMISSFQFIGACEELTWSELRVSGGPVTVTGIPGTSSLLVPQLGVQAYVEDGDEIGEISYQDGVDNLYFEDNEENRAEYIYLAKVIAAFNIYHDSGSTVPLETIESNPLGAIMFIANIPGIRALELSPDEYQDLLDEIRDSLIDPRMQHLNHMGGFMSGETDSGRLDRLDIEVNNPATSDARLQVIVNVLNSEPADARRQAIVSRANERLGN